MKEDVILIEGSTTGTLGLTDGWALSGFDVRPGGRFAFMPDLSAAFSGARAHHASSEIRHHYAFAEETIFDRRWLLAIFGHHSRAEAGWRDLPCRWCHLIKRDTAIYLVSGANR
jgi:hypothetical protein